MTNENAKSLLFWTEFGSQGFLRSQITNMYSKFKNGESNMVNENSSHQFDLPFRILSSDL